MTIQLHIKIPTRGWPGRRARRAPAPPGPRGGRYGHASCQKFVDAAASGSGSPSPPPADFERDSPVDVSSTSEAGSAGAGAGSSRALSPAPAPAPRNPQLVERWSSEEMRHIQCHLETKELWDKFNELGTEMIITKTGSRQGIETDTRDGRCAEATLQEIVENLQPVGCD
ncbi:T-box protein H15 [Eumeta japonica]|uniref:T-box protein H15 n=1 Tax=Eumeta variegata TaxID=151549 RepID=A0A4C1ZXZ5_EUMVA|nr:T-box protein H15 [Eumeta japonica]